ncbi:MAG: DUF924 domain-containing protein [Alphaproteobacteria bacterium]|nr:DUF924 domain-containing protein [Alphaproteobacteria bacterium]
MTISPDDVLNFWFEESGPDKWFEKSNLFDDEIRQRFGETTEAARHGQLEDWMGTPRGRLAQIILIDQFSRNLYRDSPLTWSADDRVLALAKLMIADGQDLPLSHAERKFVYMPFMHSEVLADQERSITLFGMLAEEGPEDGGYTLEYAVLHRDIVAQFGRFPHRNEILGRKSTPEEIAFLKEPNSSF